MLFRLDNMKTMIISGIFLIAIITMVLPQVYADVIPDEYLVERAIEHMEDQ